MAMLNDKPTCDLCQTPMRLLKRLKNCKTKKGKEYRVRRFHCDTCDLDKTIFADGVRDETLYDNYERSMINEMNERKSQERLEQGLKNDFIP